LQNTLGSLFASATEGSQVTWLVGTTVEPVNNVPDLESNGPAWILVVIVS